MFCSNCGVTLKVGAITCPHCGIPIGETRFEGSRGYTGAQERLKPGRAVRVTGDYYTRENTVDAEETVMPSDEDTTYRASRDVDQHEPLFTAQEESHESEEEEIPEEGEKKPFGFSFLRRREEEEPEPEETPEEESEELTEDDLAGLRAGDLEDSEKSEEELLPEEVKPESAAPVSASVQDFMRTLRDGYKGKKQDDAENAVTYGEDGDEEAPEEPAVKAQPKAAVRTEKKAQPKPASKPAPKAVKKPVKPVPVKEEEDDEDEEEGPTAGDKLKAFAANLFKKKSKDGLEDWEMDDEAEQEPEQEPEEETEKAEKPRKKIRLLPKRPSRAAEEEEDEEEETAESEEEEGETYEDEEMELSIAREGRLKILRVIAAALALILLVVGAVMGISVLKKKTESSPIEGVSLSLWNEGTALMQQRVGSDYRKQMLALFDKNDMTSYISLSAAYTADLDGLQSLMPENPQVNDSRFLSALSSIQESINNCLSNDALAMMDTTMTSAEKDAQSTANWEQVRSYVTTLLSCTNTGMLDGIIKGDRVEVITLAEEEEETEPEKEYTSLAKGAKGDEVTALQTRLTELGFMTSAIDGDYGNKTKTAVEKFQQTAGLDVTGIADATTQKLLYSEEAPKLN